MPSEIGATELLDRPVSGRIVERQRRVRLGDVDRSGRLRLDSVARYLQDVATDDADDAGLDRRFGWLVRRTMIRLRTPATLGEALTVETWCTGIGRSWAERRTALRGSKGAEIDTVAVWVQIDTTTGRPAAIGDDFTSAYGAACAGRRVSARLTLPSAPPDDATSHEWQVRPTDLDPFDHVNNAATWSVAESSLDLGARRGVAELEYAAPVTLEGEHRILTSAQDLWLLQGGEVAAVARWTTAPD